MKKGDLMFNFLSPLHQGRLDSALAEAQTAHLEFNNVKKQFDGKTASKQELQLSAAKLSRAQAKANETKIELDFINVRAPFDSIVDRLHQPSGFVEKGDILTGLHDNSMMQAYFNVPERRYLEYMVGAKQNQADPRIELVLANGTTFDQPGKIGAIEARFSEDTGTVFFRADFPNPKRVLRHGESGTVIMRRVLKHAILIPQRATFEELSKRWVYVVDKEKIAHRRKIVIQNGMEDVYVIEKGAEVGETIVLDGVKQVRDGEKVQYEDRELKK